MQEMWLILIVHLAKKLVLKYKNLFIKSPFTNLKKYGAAMGLASFVNVPQKLNNVKDFLMVVVPYRILFSKARNDIPLGD